MRTQDIYTRAERAEWHPDYRTALAALGQIPIPRRTAAQYEHCAALALAAGDTAPLGPGSIGRADWLAACATRLRENRSR